jgi:hypothetical protein
MYINPVISIDINAILDSLEGKKDESWPKEIRPEVKNFRFLFAFSSFSHQSCRFLSARGTIEIGAAAHDAVREFLVRSQLRGMVDEFELSPVRDRNFMAAFTIGSDKKQIAVNLETGSCKVVPFGSNL